MTREENKKRNQQKLIKTVAFQRYSLELSIYIQFFIAVEKEENDYTLNEMEYVLGKFSQSLEKLFKITYCIIHKDVSDKELRKLGHTTSTIFNKIKAELITASKRDVDKCFELFNEKITNYLAILDDLSSSFTRYNEIAAFIGDSNINDKRDILDDNYHKFVESQEYDSPCQEIITVFNKINKIIIYSIYFLLQDKGESNNAEQLLLYLKKLGYDPIYHKSNPHSSKILD